MGCCFTMFRQNFFISPTDEVDAIESMNMYGTKTRHIPWQLLHSYQGFYAEIQTNFEPMMALRKDCKLLLPILRKKLLDFLLSSFRHKTCLLRDGSCSATHTSWNPNLKE